MISVVRRIYGGMNYLRQDVLAGKHLLAVRALVLAPLADGEGRVAEVEATADHASLTHITYVETHIYHLHFLCTTCSNNINIHRS